MTPTPGIEPGPHWWEASALTTAPSLHPLNRTRATLVGGECPHHCAIPAPLIGWVLKNALDKIDMGIVLERRRSSRYRQERLSDLDFADDIRDLYIGGQSRPQSSSFLRIRALGNPDTKCLLIGFRKEHSCAFMLARAENRRRKVQIANCWL